MILPPPGNCNPAPGMPDTRRWFLSDRLSTIVRRDMPISRPDRATVPGLGQAVMTGATMQLIRTAGRQLGILLCSSTMAAAAALPAHRAQAPQYALEAAYIYNFIQFTAWPDHARRAPATVLVAGDDRVHAAMQKIADEANRSGQLRLRLDPCTGLPCLNQPQVVFIGSNQQPHLQQWLDRTRGRPVLTVSDIPGFTDRGGMIELVRHRDRLGFRINRKAIEASGLYVSAQLLQLGDIIDGEQP